jgi:hypothetical protein
MKRVRDPGLIRAVMRSRDLTFREIGLLIERPESTVRFIFDGQPIDPRLARRIARGLRRPVDELFAVSPSSAEQVRDQQEAVA